MDAAEGALNFRFDDVMFQSGGYGQGFNLSKHQLLAQL